MFDSRNWQLNLVELYNFWERDQKFFAVFLPVGIMRVPNKKWFFLILNFVSIGLINFVLIHHAVCLEPIGGLVSGNIEAV